MANKHITNPCPMSSKEPPSETETPYYRLPNEHTVRLVCPECSNLVSLNKGNGKLRSHSINN